MNSGSQSLPFRKGFEFEKKYHGCAQCAVAALYSIYPELTNNDVFRSAGGLGGGLGLTCRGQCGALSGAVMVIGQTTGRDLDDIQDPGKKRTHAFRLAREMADRFTGEFGSVICMDIHHRLMGRHFDLWDTRQKSAFERAGAHAVHCPFVVGKAVEWASGIIERGIPGQPDACNVNL